MADGLAVSEAREQSAVQVVLDVSLRQIEELDEVGVLQDVAYRVSVDLSHHR